MIQVFRFLKRSTYFTVGITGIFGFQFVREVNSLLVAFVLFELNWVTASVTQYN